MADVFERYGYNTSTLLWDIDLSNTSTDYLGFFGATFLSGISPGGFNRSTHKTVVSPSVAGDDKCASPHMRNCRYVSAASQTDDGQVSLDEAAAVDLTTTNVTAENCTLKWYYEDDSPANTVLTNVRLFAYDGSNVNNPPTDVIVVAAEFYDDSPQTIYKDRDSDAAGDGGAWDGDGSVATSGINSITNALICSDRSSAASHDYYFLISATPLSKGTKTGKIRFEADVA